MQLSLDIADFVLALVALLTALKKRPVDTWRPPFDRHTARIEELERRVAQLVHDDLLRRQGESSVEKMITAQSNVLGTALDRIEEWVVRTYDLGERLLKRSEWMAVPTPTTRRAVEHVDEGSGDPPSVNESDREAFLAEERERQRVADRRAARNAKRDLAPVSTDDGSVPPAPVPAEAVDDDEDLDEREREQRLQFIDRDEGADELP